MIEDMFVTTRGNDDQCHQRTNAFVPIDQSLYFQDLFIRFANCAEYIDTYMLIRACTYQGQQDAALDRMEYEPKIVRTNNEKIEILIAIF